MKYKEALLYLFNSLACYTKWLNNELLYHTPGDYNLKKSLLKKMIPGKVRSTNQAACPITPHMPATSININFLEQGPDNRKRILVIDESIPTPDRDAGSRTMVAFMETMVVLGKRVDFIPWIEAPRNHYMRQLEVLGVNVIDITSSGNNLSSWLKKNSASYPSILISRPSYVTLSAIKLLKNSCNARVLYYGHDLHYLRNNRKMGLKGIIDQSPCASQFLLSLEKRIWKCADSILYPSEEECAHVRSFLKALGKANLVHRVIPYYYHSVCSDNNDSMLSRVGVLFVGNFHHDPNRDAAIWLAREIMPILWKANVNVKLTIVGAGPGPDILSLATDKVHVAANVSDEQLSEYYKTSRVVAVPLRYGAGVKNKVMEALSHGVPVVSTSIGVEGMGDMSEILDISDGSQDFADSINKLVSNHYLAEKRSIEGREYIKSNWSFRALVSNLSLIIDDDMVQTKGAKEGIT